MSSHLIRLTVDIKVIEMKTPVTLDDGRSVQNITVSDATKGCTLARLSWFCVT